MSLTRSTCLQREATITIACDIIHLSYLRLSRYESFTCACDSIDKLIRLRGARGILFWVTLEERGAKFAAWETAGVVFEDHFHPGASVPSSNRERIASDEMGASLPDGSNRRVSENPGIFRLVYSIMSIVQCEYNCVRRGTHHESARKYPLDINIDSVQVLLHLAYNTPQFKFTQSA